MNGTTVFFLARHTAYLIVLLVLAMAGGCGTSTDNPAAVSLQSEEQTDRSRESQAFDKTFAQWKTFLAKLRDLDLQYRTAAEFQKPEKKPEIKEQYDRMLEQGKVLETELVDTAVLAFVKSPYENEKLVYFLMGVANMEVRSERYESALRIAQMLIDNEVDNAVIRNAAGIVAFNVGEFKLAEQHLRRAEKNKAISQIGKTDLAQIEYYKKAWEREKKLRDAQQAANDLPRVVLKTTKGEIELELFENEAPNTVANVISLVEKGFDAGLEFHRVVGRFTAQAGCPKGDGTGGPGYVIPCECYLPEHRLHFRGSLSMAHSGPHTGGSQFHITFVPTGQLDGKHTVFGQVVRGMDVLARLTRRVPRDPMEVKMNPHRNIIIPPADKILEAKVLRKRSHEYDPTVFAIPQSKQNTGAGERTIPR